MKPPDKRKAPEGSGADADTNRHQPESYSYLGHEGHMRLLADRIRWLERHRHWWIREVDRRRKDEAA